MSNPYPAQIAAPGGGPVKVAGDLTFTDPANQPGGSLPAEWTVAADGGLTVDISDADGAIIVELASDHNTKVTQAVADNGDGTKTASVIAKGTGGGTGGLAGYLRAQNGSIEGDAGTLYGDGTLEMFTAAGRSAITAWDGPGNTLRFALLPAGQPMVGVVAAPADGDLSASQVALWFDDTDGAAKLMIKGKSANGTVVTGQVALS